MQTTLVPCITHPTQFHATLQVEHGAAAGRQLASTLTAVTALTSAALMPAMGLALAASCTRQALAAVCLAAAALSWAALPAVWGWLAARSEPAAARLHMFLAAPGPGPRRRGQPPAQQQGAARAVGVGRVQRVQEWAGTVVRVLGLSGHAWCGGYGRLDTVENASPWAWIRLRPALLAPC